MNCGNERGQVLPLVALCQELWRLRKLLALSLVGAVLLTIIVCAILPEKYRAETTLMPTESGRSGVASMLSGLAGGLGGAAADPSIKMISFLESRSLAMRVVESLELRETLCELNEVSETRCAQYPMAKLAGALKKHMTFFYDSQKNLISVQALFRDPELAARVSAAYAQGLHEMLHARELREKTRQREFLEGQLFYNKLALLASGKALQGSYARGGARGDRDELTLSLRVNEVIAKHLAAQDAESEIQWPEGFIQRSPQDARELQVKGVPHQAYLQYLTLEREILAQITRRVAEQFEFAKIDEVKVDHLFEVVDDAIVPQSAYFPKTKLFVALAMVLVVLLFVAIAFVRISLPQRAVIE